MKLNQIVDSLEGKLQENLRRQLREYIKSFMDWNGVILLLVLDEKSSTAHLSVWYS